MFRAEMFPLPRLPRNNFHRCDVKLNAIVYEQQKSGLNSKTENLPCRNLDFCVAWPSFWPQRVNLPQHYSSSLELERLSMVHCFFVLLLYISHVHVCACLCECVYV